MSEERQTGRAWPPRGRFVGPRDRALLPVYLRLLDAAEAQAAWEEAAEIVLGLDVAAEGAKELWAAYLARAQWMVDQGWTQLATVD